MVKGILQNPIYEGDLLHQKTYMTESVPFIHKHNRGELPQYLISDNHEPIITREEAEAVRQLYEYRRQKQCVDDTTVYQSRYAFSSKILCGECGSTFRRQKIYIGKPYEKIQWSCHLHIEDISKCRRKAVREDIIKQTFITMWNRFAGNYEEILYPLLAIFKAVPGDPEQEQELQKLDQMIQNLKQQSHMLRKVLSDGNIGSAVFIEKRNQIDIELEAAHQRQQRLNSQKLYEHEISQTEYLLTVFRNRPVFIEEFDEELFSMTIENVIVQQGTRLTFRLKNGLELDEYYGKEAVGCSGICQSAIKS